METTMFAQPAIFEENKRFTAVGPTGTATVSQPTPYLRENALVFGDCTFSASVINKYNTSENYGFNVIYYRERGGTYPLFDENSTLTVEEQDACSVVTVNTPLAEGLHNATATTTLFLWKHTPMVTATVTFDAERGTEFRTIEFYLEGGRTFVEGEWIAPEEGKPFSQLLPWFGDLAEFDARYPFVFNFTAEDSVCPPPAVLTHAPRKSDTFSVSGGGLTVHLKRMASGLALYAMDDEQLGRILSPRISWPLFSSVLLDKEQNEYVITSLDGWRNVAVQDTPDGKALLFSEHECEELKGVSVELRAITTDGVAWEADLRCRNNKLTVVRFIPPRLTFDLTDDSHIFLCNGPGQFRPILQGQEYTYASHFPCMEYSMQYMGGWPRGKNRGIYCGYQDPTGALKEVSVIAHDNICTMGMMIPAEGITEVGNGFHLNGEVLWKITDDGWYGATMLYRDFVFTRASWFNAVRIEDRTDLPQWLKETPYWILGSVKKGDGDGLDATIFDDLLTIQKEVGVPVGWHAYNWHEIPFDSNYPHYNPARDVFLQMVPKLKESGMKIMPYINGRLWDTQDRGDEDWLFSSYAYPSATKGTDGKPCTESYRSTRADGTRRQLAVMCPSEPLWQDKVVDNCRWILEDLGCDAVYIDQISAAPPECCLDRNHSHRPGGGSWWYPNYYTIMKRLCRMAPPDTGFTSESNGEPHVGHIGGMLVWHWHTEWSVPAFPVVYVGYQTLLGRNYSARRDPEGKGFRVLTAQSLCYGDGMGWLYPEDYLNSPYRDFFRRMVQLRYKHNDFFAYGEFKPLFIDSDLPAYDKAGLYSEVVVGGVRIKSDGSRLLVLANTSEEEQTVQCHTVEGEHFTFTVPALDAVVKIL